MLITGKEDYPNAEWAVFPLYIGKIGSQDLYYLGKDKVDRDNLVAVFYGYDVPLEPVPLGNLLKWSQEPIEIGDQFEKLLSSGLS
jgi:hypothetical protein